MMQSRCKAFGGLLIVCTILWSVQCDENAEDFVKKMEDEVRRIAVAAQQNYADTCEIVRTCLSPQNCSRLECYPLSNQENETACVSVDSNPWCTSTTEAPCHSVKANSLRGYVRTPPVDLSSGGGSTIQHREIYFGSTVCAQRELDRVFVSVNTFGTNASDGSLYLQLYFGSVDGTFRYFPGREILTAACGKYDPRKRSWYTGAISVLKDLVILIDVGEAMHQPAQFLNPTPKSYLEIATSTMSMLVRTLVAGDRVTVLPVNVSGSYPETSSYQYRVPANDRLDEEDPDFQRLLSYLNGSAFARIEATGIETPTNFTDGFVKANSTVSILSPSSSMKIVILITNSESNNSPSNGDRSAAEALKKSVAQLFVYDLNPGKSLWDSLACKESDDNIQDWASVNPLLYLSSYFSFLASARIAANDGHAPPFWQSPYSAASGLGQVITVAFPAMSSDGQLIGVAGIDVQLAGLHSDPQLKSGVEALLDNSPYRVISQFNETGGDIGVCNTSYRTSCPDISSGDTTSLCIHSTEPASDAQLTALLCCTECSGRDSSGDNKVIVFGLVGALCGLLVVLIMVAVIYLLRKSRRSPRRRAANDYPYDVLWRATDGFATRNIIGRGSFGVVYKAVLPDETVAVKMLSQPADRAEDFEAEIKILGLTKHQNLVELKGVCFERAEECCLVYELVDGGDLHHLLWPEEQSARVTGVEFQGPTILSWNRRQKIARGIARGLNYLHRGLQPNGSKVYHLDIKPHNILLGFDLNPKIADFGISQLYKPGHTFKVASVISGTFGYMAPEIIQGHVKPNSKLDVFSYGMVLLQLLSGRKLDDPKVKPFLLQWARTHVEDGFVEKVVDENLIGTVQEAYRDNLMANCKQLISLALRCLSNTPESRPEMCEVLEAIDNLEVVLDLDTTSLIGHYEDDEPGSDYCEKAKCPDEGFPPSSGTRAGAGRRVRKWETM